MKRLAFTVTNDLTYDQRMIRICSSLQRAGYLITLIGRRTPGSDRLHQQPFKQKRLPVFFQTGPLFYVEYNIRIFFFLLFYPIDAVCVIDLDTILPGLFVSKLKRIKRFYDAHELFCEMKEIVTRPNVYAVWKKIEQYAVPQFSYGYTVNEPIREIFKKEYAVDYAIICNVPPLLDIPLVESEDFIIYQGAVNHGRSFETLIPAFQYINVPLHIYGDGNFMESARVLVAQYSLENKIIFKGKLAPAELRKVTPKALLGLTLFENNGLNNYYSLANRFFDYVHAGIPQICVDYPVYRGIASKHKVAVLISALDPQTIADTIRATIANKELLSHMKEQSMRAREVYNWQNEEKKLINFYNTLFNE